MLADSAVIVTLLWSPRWAFVYCSGLVPSWLRYCIVGEAQLPGWRAWLRSLGVRIVDLDRRNASRSSPVNCGIPSVE